MIFEHEGDQSQYETCVLSLFPRLKDNEIGIYGVDLVVLWLNRMSLSEKLSIVWNLFDIVTDGMFTFSLLDSHPTLAYVACLSFVFSSACFLLLLFLDLTVFASSKHTEALDQQRRIL